MNEVVEILKKVGAVITDNHFVYTSGKHGSVYVNKDAIYPHTAETSRLGELFALNHRKLGIDVVVGPALGGIILSQWAAHHLSKLTKREVLGIYTEKDEQKNQIFTRGYDKLVMGKNVLVVEDITTTGGSVKKVVDAVGTAGGQVLAVGVIVNRDPININSDSIGAPYSALAEFPAEAFDESKCPLCQRGVPINTEFGHGRKYVEETNKT